MNELKVKLAEPGLFIVILLVRQRYSVPSS